MAGKLTDDCEMSASRLPGLMGFSKYSTPNDELQYSINAIDGHERPDIGNEAMAWGNTLEPVILAEACQRLGIDDFNVNITEPYKHRTLALQCSLDGIGFGLGQEVTTNPDKGIYVLGQDSIVLNGPGVLEAKLTKTRPEDTPHLARGPIQLQGQMLVTGHKWGAVCVLYQGIELRVFLFAPHPKTQAAIAQAVEEFQKKLDTYRMDGTIDWYAPASSKEMDKIHPVTTTEEIDLPAEAQLLADRIVSTKQEIKDSEAVIEAAEMRLKQLMGDAKRGKAGKFSVIWPMRQFKAQPERLIPAKEAYSLRQSTLTIKELE
jgi:predicted phage-related endonuclease